MSGKIESVYLDTCIFLAHIKNEQRVDPKDLQGINEIVKVWNEHKIHIVTSTLTITEILLSRVGDDAYETFNRFFQHRTAYLVSVSRPIAEMASEVRDYYDIQYQKHKTLTTPDANHLATAIWFGCTKFYTFDEKEDHTRKNLPLIPLGPRIADKYNLVILKPQPIDPGIAQLALPSQ